MPTTATPPGGPRHPADVPAPDQPPWPLDPPLECDLVMKGGITSGVIYPEVVCELARTYRLRSVGGASAGTIAAAAAAAAEVGRASGGFDLLARLPHDITRATTGGDTTLFGLFQPSRASRPLFRAFTAAMGRSGAAAVRATLGAVAAGFWAPALVGAAAGLVLLGVSAGGSGAARWAGVLAGALLAVVGALAGVVVGMLRILGGPVPREGFGLCSGMPTAGSATPALTPWLHDRLQEMAGRTAGSPPLTFGDLTAAGVELRTMTTNLTRHQPMAMPWQGREYFFDPAVMRGLLPEDVVAWLEQHSPALPDGAVASRDVALLRRQALPLLPLPDGPDLPVLLATRMSLSFPVLITAVPLHAVDYAAPANRAARRAATAWLREHPDAPLETADGVLPLPRLEPNWFSDGGICSNLPVHFFDSPLPSRPTFAVDLATFPEGRTRHADEGRNSRLSSTNLGGVLRPWYRWPSGGLGALAGFAMAVVETARGWVDAGQLVMPGYRDRVVTIWHDADEGGMNLRMPAPVVTALAARGRGAGAKLVTRFAGNAPGVVPGQGWENHRWVRLRTATAGLDDWLATLRASYVATAPGQTPYPDLAGPGADAPLPAYDLTVARRRAVNARTGELLDLAASWSSNPADAFTHGAPAPRPRLRLVPDDGTGAGEPT